MTWLQACISIKVPRQTNRCKDMDVVIHLRHPIPTAHLQHAWVMDHIHPTHAFTMSNVPSTVLKPFKYTVKGKNMID